MIKGTILKILDKHYQKQGFYQWYGVNWLRDSKKAYKESKLPAKMKKWAIKRGFLPWRIEQYGLTEENWKDNLSDKEYSRLYPINGKQRIWIDDKLTIKYMLHPFDEYMPKYYYHILNTRGCRILKLADCPEKYSSEENGIIELMKEEGALAIKKISGAYGVGFCKLSFENGNYYINNKPSDIEQIKEVIVNLNDHIVCEYVKMHEDIARLNPGALNTIRVMVVNENGDNPEIMHAFLRIGTKASGVVDNTGQGGMFARIDMENGRFYDGEKIENHIISSSPKHPDTGEDVEGIIPHWSTIKEKLIEVSKYIPQLEYMGFDIAVTAEGFKIIEINSHQGLHRYHTYPQSVKDYFARKTSLKK